MTLKTHLNAKKKTKSYVRGYWSGYEAGVSRYKFKKMSITRTIKCNLCQANFIVKLVKEQFICENHYEKFKKL